MIVLLELIRIGWTFRDRGWYRRYPFLPLPPRDYLRWRMETAYGDKSLGNARWKDIAAYARWRRELRLRGHD
ncbi:MAG: hypothetical protein OXG96_00225 [Acidobacteria bacterium]|nr:hypothetical protein [Acidobacteriota bacterium]